MRPNRLTIVAVEQSMWPKLMHRRRLRTVPSDIASGYLREKGSRDETVGRIHGGTTLHKCLATRSRGSARCCSSRLNGDPRVDRSILHNDSNNNDDDDQPTMSHSHSDCSQPRVCVNLSPSFRPGHAPPHRRWISANLASILSRPKCLVRQVVRSEVRRGETWLCAPQHPHFAWYGSHDVSKSLG
ncbi:hypothetical protein BC834DRAFT_638332 [Gloeopeniophorella convolvens]|nr:hypothetical protein BC834DRAFT_638332 [Gloeopeniophorella convolvens]